MLAFVAYDMCLLALAASIGSEQASHHAAILQNSLAAPKW